MFFHDRLRITITCAAGLEKTVKNELFRLGYGVPAAINGAFTVSGSARDVVKLNVCLRSADRVYVELAGFPAETFDELFEGVKKIPFESFMPKTAAVVVDGKCVKSKIFAISACQSVVKKAIVTRLCEKYEITSLSETGEKYQVDFALYNDVVSVRLNTSGAGLHKRGYRDKVWIAPIKETLAAGLVLLSDYYYTRPLADTFCGSGTIAIEGAMIAQNIAPNLSRYFAFDGWSSFDKRIKNDVIDEAKDKEYRTKDVTVYASDINAKAVALAEYHAKRAGVKDVVKFAVKDVKDVKFSEPRGTIVVNPPYGERVIDRAAARECYAALGRVAPKGWSVFIITSDQAFERFYGKKADRKRKLFNSEKRCDLYYYYGKKEI